MTSGSQPDNIEVEIRQENTELLLNSEQIKELVKKVCAEFGIVRAAVSLSVIGDEEITGINKKFLNHNYSTDVISFDLSDESTGSSYRVFDIIVNQQKAQRESEKLGHPPASELALYITHGLLHNLGFDDANSRKAQEMQNEEKRLLRKFGYGEVSRGN